GDEAGAEVPPDEDAGPASTEVAAEAEIAAAPIPAEPAPRARPAAKAAAKPAAKPAPKPAQQPEARPEPAAAPARAPAASSAGAGNAPAAAGETTVRVDTSRLDEIMNMVGELVLVRNRLQNLKASIQDEDMIQAVANLDVVTSDLQLSVMKTRMQPIKKVFGRFPRVVRDLARSLRKEIDLTLVGEETDLDKNLVEALADPLVHLVRNAVDHGIEMPDEREQVGKPRKGTVVLSAAQEGDHIILSIRDDGKGMNADVLRRKAVEKGMMDEEAAARLDERDCFNLIFAPGFSTKTEISDVSGRGVGMDVVKTRIAQMNGQVEIDSVEGKGSTITIKLPLTLAILPTLMVVLDTQPFALPLSSVVEIFNLDLRKRNVVDGRQTVMVRNRALPLFFLRQWLIKNSVFDVDNYANGSGHVVVVNMGGVQVGLVVDHLVGQEEVVIKPLGSMIQGIDGLAGATITGDGKIALILDVPGLMRKYAHRF
ncbi:MAG: chemotaxis protein CheA, partial [Gammaproteobacteria bacterium]|nr:chemotaxis protein CheA [Gammaproteobacteria bacterium]